MNKTVTVRKMFFLILIFLFANITLVSASPGRWEKEISGEGWRLWLDHAADWYNDDVCMPPVDVSALPVNPPTCGWDKLDRVHDKIVNVPGTVEEHFWSANGNPNGVAGDYRGVSWWSTTFMLNPSLRSKRITIAFKSVNLRAEIFINQKLVGYDVIGNTPFEVNATDALIFGGENRLDVRITDPVGNFDWSDENLMPWGNNRVPSVHGFGGITGRVFIRAVDAVHVEDIYVQNKPDPKEAEVFITLGNSSGERKKGELTLVVHEWKNPANVLWKKTVSESIPPEGREISLHVKAPKAKLWDIMKPNLYEAAVTFTGDDGKITDSMSRRFGFRWFDIGEKNGDKRFYLNGKRVFIIAAMTRGFWPKNGIFSTPEMARKDINIAMNFGYNMMLYHRAIGQPLSIETADEAGLLTYEEPGGYMCNEVPNKTEKKWRREKLRRMIIRDRSHPSMVIFNMDDLSFEEPDDDDKKNIRMVHSLDPSRPVTFNCITRPTIPNYKNNPYKLHMKPYDNNLYYHGWTSPYHLVAYGGYLDEYYRNPRYYLRYVIDPVSTMGDSLHPMPKDEIIFFGEEGAFGTPVRLEKIKSELARTGADGWRECEHLDWYDSYDRFLDESGLRSSFSTVDDLTMALAENLHYFHGRILENVRISNAADAYVLNGWASASTHTDIVDTYRNPTGDPSILRYYTRPLYIAVKIRDKVLPAGAIPVADVFIINEKNLRGNHNLTLEFEDQMGRVEFSKNFKVKIRGGEEFGQLLVEEFQMPPVKIHGYYNLRAILRDKKNVVIAEGYDDIFTVDYMTGPGIKGKAAVIDESGAINAFLKESRGMAFGDFDPQGPDLDYIIIGAHDYAKVRSMGNKRGKGFGATDPIMERVANGATLIILDQADRWASQMGSFSYLSVKYTGSEHWSNRGRLFTGKSPLLRDLPESQAMNWEYQVFYRGDVWGLRLAPQGVETIVGLAAQDRDEILNALSRIPFGNGQIIITTLRILPELSSEKPQSAVAKKLFLNLLEYSE